MRCKKNGDILGAGEWLVSKLPYVYEEQVEEVVSKVIALWASPIELRSLPTCIVDLISRIDEFVPEDLTLAFVATTLHVQDTSHSLPPAANDLAFRLSEFISCVFGVEARRPIDTGIAAAAKLKTFREELMSTVDFFLNTNCVTAKTASIEVVRRARQLKRLTLAAERPILSEIDVLLGAAFRKFCESCERDETKGIIKRGPDLREQAKRTTSSTRSHANSVLWNLTVYQITQHVVKLVDEATFRSEAATTPSLRLASSVFKLDLTRLDREMIFSCRLVNHGEGRALGVTAVPDLSEKLVELQIKEPNEPFEIGGNSEQIVTFGVTLRKELDSLRIPLMWKCTSLTSRIHEDADELIIEQQRVQPNWNRLLENPPYAINPIKERENLFGRDDILNRLLLHASGGSSTFLWGQKRVGKTSVLQVLASILRQMSNFICVLLRMGEIGSLHEGQIAHTIAERLCAQAPHNDISIPSDQAFGAGLGSLVPFVEDLVRTLPNTKFVVIIDEFDDLNPAFYTGERGKLFVKALRSLSEIGLTFFFVGSERMSTIYGRHEVDLNKWVNVSLDCIESREDCKALVVKPVDGVIEYQPECVDSIIDYCGRNPFYMHLLCHEVFKKCWQENRTYVSESDIQSVIQLMIRALGATNFSHFWDDNPELNEEKNAKQAAENCLILCCLSSLGGRCKSIDELFAAQDRLGLGVSERLSSRDIRVTVERLQNRGIISAVRASSGVEVSLPILKDWLKDHAELNLLCKWRDFCRTLSHKEKIEKHSVVLSVTDAPFPIQEDDILSVSQSLVYCGKQKDVSEIRIWLKQFDDDVRIELAFLLLKRLAEKGFVNEGAKLVALGTLQEALQESRERIGHGKWAFALRQRRRVNLCVTFVDSEMKSGATTAREMAKRLQPGKQGSPGEISNWAKSNYDRDPIILIVDDFAGTGSTLLRGLANFFQQVGNKKVIDTYLKEGRILCYLMYSFPEAIQRLQCEYPEIQFLSANVLGDGLRALDTNAGIFDNEEDLQFAKEVLIQIGRELYQQYPLGYGDMGALVCFHNTIPNNTLPIFWCSGTVNDKPWRPLFPRA